MNKVKLFSIIIIFLNLNLNAIETNEDKVLKKLNNGLQNIKSNDINNDKVLIEKKEKSKEKKRKEKYERTIKELEKGFKTPVKQGSKTVNQNSENREWIIGSNIGITNIKLNNNEKEYGFNASYNMNRKFENIKGIRVGPEIGLDYFKISDNKNGYTMSISLMGGYSFKDEFKIPIELMIGGGYQFGYINDQVDNLTQGFYYKGNFNYCFTDYIGMGLEFKKSKLKQGIDFEDINLKSTNVYFIFRI